MAKEINEKTFELNITHELLDVSKTIFLMMVLDNDGPEPPLEYLKLLFKHMNETRLFAEGLTQAEESSVDGGYDVSINIHHRNGVTARAMFLQFKSGIRRKYSRTPGSVFSNQEAALSEHIAFSFNDAANTNQHTLLREFSEKDGISPDSVMYVFPRITEKETFREKLGDLINHSSFVPINSIDKQAKDKKIDIKKGTSHKYRTSYDGALTEINLLLLLLVEDYSIEPRIIVELVCIHIERFANILRNDDELIDYLINIISKQKDYSYLLKNAVLPYFSVARDNFQTYLKDFVENYRSNKQVLEARIEFTSKVPHGGLKINFKERSEYESIMYQIF